MKSIHSLIRLSVLFLALAAPKFAEASECHCQIVKSDCGDCNQNCVAKDFGNIDDLKWYSSGKKGTCEDACNVKVNGISNDDACTGLATNIHVPMPWGGQIQACYKMGSQKRRTGDRKNVVCKTETVGFNYDSAPYWKMTLNDDFKGKPANATPEVADCYDRKPRCGTTIAWPLPIEDCPATVTNQLKDLNKCTWTVMVKDNWMAPDLNAFDPREVSIDPNLDNGVLILHAHGVHPDGSYYPVAKRQTGSYINNKNLPKGYDCSLDGGSLKHDSCPFVSGAVTSTVGFPGGPQGFKQLYGRFDIRAKLSSGPGSWPALWGTGDGMWPGGGEFDLLEAYDTGVQADQTFHMASCNPGDTRTIDFNACIAGGGSVWHQTKGVGTKFYNLPKRTPFDRDYHTYSVQWDPEKVIFSIDGVANNTIHRLDPIQSDFMSGNNRPAKKKDQRQIQPALIPDSPFAFLLNITIKHNDSGKKAPDPTNFYPQMMFIDWVHAYQRCTTQEEFCPNGGGFDPRSGSCSNEFAKADSKTGTNRKIASASSPYQSPCQTVTIRP